MGIVRDTTALRLQGAWSATVTDDGTGQTRRLWLITDGDGPLDVHDTIAFFTYRDETVLDIRDHAGRVTWKAS